MVVFSRFIGGADGILGAAGWVGQSGMGDWARAVMEAFLGTEACPVGALAECPLHDSCVVGRGLAATHQHA